MREMKDSGIPWIGMIPKGWALLRTKNQYHSRKVIAGDTASQYERLALTLGGVIKRSKDDSTGLQPESFEGYQVLQEGELVFKLIDLENLATSRVGYSPYTGIVSPAYVILHPEKGVNARFGEYYFLSLWHRAIFNSLGDNGVRSNLNAGDLLGIPYVAPPILEQNRIIDFLDTKCTEIDSILENTRASIEDYKALKLSVITEAVTKGIRGERSMKDSGVKWIGDIPVEWGIIRKLSFLCNKSISYGIIKLFDPEENGVPVLRCSDVKAGYIDSSNIRTVSKSLSDEYKRTILKGGEIVINVRGTLGGCALVPEWMKGFNVAREVAVIDTSGIVSRYLMYYLLSNAFSTYEQIHLSGCVYVGLNIELLSSCPIPFPSLEEQQEIAAYLDEKCAAIDSLIASKEALIAELEAYKKSIIYEYVTGKKEVI